MLPVTISMLLLVRQQNLELLVQVISLHLNRNVNFETGWLPRSYDIGWTSEKSGLIRSPGGMQVLQDGTGLTISISTIPELLQVRLGTGLQLSSTHGVFPWDSSQDTQTLYSSISLSPNVTKCQMKDSNHCDRSAVSQDPRRGKL